MRITLTVIDGPHVGLEFDFDRHDTFLVGRSQHAHFQLPLKDKYFSRIHFLMEVNPPHCRLVDLGSHNGTYVNGQQVFSCDLQDGDQIRAGHTILRLRLQPTSMDGVAEEDGGTVLTDQAPGGALGEYQLLEEIGQGSMGKVYRAQRKDGALAALKVLVPNMPAGSVQVDNFLRQARALTSLEHPHIARLSEVGRHDRFLYFVSELVPGRDAAAILKEQGPLPIRRALRWIVHALAALAHGHARGQVHRDLKPGNLLVTEKEGKEVVKLSFYGLARVFQESQLSGLTMTGGGGAVYFLPPEYIFHYQDSDPKGDQYAAAATLYTLLTDHWVYDLPEEMHLRFSMLLRQKPVPIRDRRPEVPEALAAVIHKALARNPAHRFPDVATFRKALVDAVG